MKKLWLKRLRKLWLKKLRKLGMKRLRKFKTHRSSQGYLKSLQDPLGWTSLKIRCTAWKIKSNSTTTILVRMKNRMAFRLPSLLKSLMLKMGLRVFVMLQRSVERLASTRN